MPIKTHKRTPLKNRLYQFWILDWRFWMANPRIYKASGSCIYRTVSENPEVLNPDGKTLQFRCLAALAAKFIDNICIKQTVFRQK